jgi:hypothetical protein
MDGAKAEVRFRGATLKYLPERQILVLHDVIANHVGSVERRPGYKAFFWSGAQTELFGGSFMSGVRRRTIG